MLAGWLETALSVTLRYKLAAAAADVYKNISWWRVVGVSEQARVFFLGELHHVHEFFLCVSYCNCMSVIEVKVKALFIGL